MTPELAILRHLVGRTAASAPEICTACAMSLGERLRKVEP